MKNPKNKPLGRNPYHPLVPQPEHPIFDYIKNKEINDNEVVEDYDIGKTGVTSVVGHK